MNDEMRLAWARINWILDTVGDGPEYHEAWDHLAKLVYQDMKASG